MKTRRKKTVTKVSIIFDALSSLNVGDKINKTEFITLHWGECDWFIERTFDVAFCNAKKQLPTKVFRSRRDKTITRLS
jgi:hypothetical protein